MMKHVKEDDDTLEKLAEEALADAEIKDSYGGYSTKSLLTLSPSLLKRALYFSVSSVDINSARKLTDHQISLIENLLKENGAVTINTKKHMYFYSLRPNDIYIRAARYDTCQRGVAFNQNFRQRSGAMQETYMVQDNNIAAEPLPMEPQDFASCSLTNPGQIIEQCLSEEEKTAFYCRYGIFGREKLIQGEIAKGLGKSRSTVFRLQKKALEKVLRSVPKEQTIYWTVSDYTQNTIYLNGCQGDQYEWKMPTD
jgi:hypothetical protein